MGYLQQYTGQQYDSVTSQYYLRARYYNPVAGRFMQEDVHKGDGLNLYAYCGNNPVMYYDPSGYANDSNCVSANFGEPLEDDALVVRGGTSTPENLQINQSKDPRGHISANGGNGMSVGELATSPKPFPNGQISVTTVGDIRGLGMDVIPDPNDNNRNHVSIVPNSNPITAEDASALSGVFNQQNNEWRQK